MKYTVSEQFADKIQRILWMLEAEPCLKQKQIKNAEAEINGDYITGQCNFKWGWIKNNYAFPLILSASPESDKFIILDFERISGLIYNQSLAFNGK